MLTTPRRRLAGPATAVLGIALALSFSSLPTPDDVAASQPPRPLGPDVQALLPANGPAAGGNTVTVRGQRLGIGIRVLFGGTPATIRSRSDQEFVVQAPAGLSGTTVQVQVEAPVQYLTTSQPYTYDGWTRRPVTASPTRGTPAGGTEVTLTGAGIDFAGTKSVTFAGRPATILRSSTNQVVVTSPPGEPKSRAQVTIETADGHLEGLQSSVFVYNANAYPPEITSVTPRTAFSGYGNVQIEGIALDEVTGVKIGGREIPNFYGSDLGISAGVPALPAGTYDVEVTTTAGTSANTSADDLTLKALPGAPVIDSVSPNQARQFDVDEITVRGRNLTDVTSVRIWNSETDLVHVSDTELRVKLPFQPPVGTYPIEASSPGGTSVNRYDDPTDDLVLTERPDAPTGPMVLSRTQGAPDADGYASIEMSVGESGVLLRRLGGVKIGNGDVFRDGVIESFEPPYTSVRVRFRAGQPGVTETIRLLRQTAPYVYEQINTDQDRFTWAPPEEEPPPTPTPTPETVSDHGYVLTGSATLKSLAKGALPLSGRLEAKVGAPSGTVSGAIALSPATGRLTALGFLPVTARIQFVQSGAFAGTLRSGVLQAVAKMRIKIPSVKLFGIELANGANCQTKAISSVTLTNTRGPFELGAGGGLAGTFDISDLAGCGLLTGLVSPLTKSSGNAIALQLSPAPRP